ncbi:hypothetical protein MHLP_03675 [Candidatus Mycoplasma haematolamae str. Purdue]|uniref:Uncharacterized protein n=1 Tax=Mycoplasma haematolamae (strain Purdue) TaxID=1212765 RepID=I7BAI3_MYCHA|nr:hypothetical protein [Candidatus Mycoplasma haematolamae]AFO52315.1 hypothetical protein MHLP_03675 [Candidatus Mycoplasma haematolamae str. Purdue]
MAIRGTAAFFVAAIPTMGASSYAVMYTNPPVSEKTFNKLTKAVGLPPPSSKKSTGLQTLKEALDTRKEDKFQYSEEVKAEIYQRLLERPDLAPKKLSFIDKALKTVDKELKEGKVKEEAIRELSLVYIPVGWENRELWELAYRHHGQYSWLGTSDHRETDKPSWWERHLKDKYKNYWRDKLLGTFK